MILLKIRDKNRKLYKSKVKKILRNGKKQIKMTINEVILRRFHTIMGLYLRR